MASTSAPGKRTGKGIRAGYGGDDADGNDRPAKRRKIGPGDGEVADGDIDCDGEGDEGNADFTTPDTENDNDIENQTEDATASSASSSERAKIAAQKLRLAKLNAQRAAPGSKPAAPLRVPLKELWQKSGVGLQAGNVFRKMGTGTVAAGKFKMPEFKNGKGGDVEETGRNAPPALGYRR
ncbi:hypothetical protein HDU93_005123 [Gonapodya sp. JEL0774]|nr:hypothetical protein HDU93_005123 [Gonapodya sp. JEL0774]